MISISYSTQQDNANRSLAYIEEFPQGGQTFHELFDFIKKIWNCDFGSYHARREPARCTCDIRHGQLYRHTIVLITGGYHENEDIIKAMMDNRTIWLSTWYKSERGGYYEFKF